MKKIVRDDIIKLESYVAAEFKFKEELEIIKGCGGYFFLDQAKTLWADKGGEYFVKKMEDAKLLTKSNFGSFVYYRLSTSALKYLNLRDSEKDYSATPKSKLPGGSLSPYPSDKVLFSSVLLLEMQNYFGDHLTREGQIQNLKSVLLVDKQNEKNEIRDNIEKKKDTIQKIKLVNQFTEPPLVEINKQIKEIKEKIQELQKELKLKQEEASFFNKNKSELERITGEITSSEYFLSNLSTIKNNLKYFHLAEHEYHKNNLLLELDSIEKEEEYSRVEGQKIIDMFMKYRDSGKVVFTFDQPRKDNPKALNLVVYVLSVRFPSNYLGLINNAIKLIRKSSLNIYVENILVVFGSVFSNDKNILETDMLKSLKQIGYTGRSERMHYVFDKMQRYFEGASSEISYIKKRDLESYQMLSEKLSRE